MPKRRSLRRPPALALAALAGLAAAAVGAFASPRPHNVVIFVADGLRSALVSPETAPEMAALRAEGVDFANSHSLYPTVTTPNASAIATGHGLGDTGDFGNVIFTRTRADPDTPALLTSLENDVVLGRMNALFQGDYLHETSLLAAARAAGFATAAIGKLGPTAIQDVTARAGESIIVDDATEHPGGLPLAPDFKAALVAAGIDPAAEDRGLNGDPGDYMRSGVKKPNTVQQDWFVSVAKVALERFKAAGKPFVLVFWSRDPDGTQHFNGDSLNSLEPGVNGPTSLAAVRNADDDLRALRGALRRLGLEDTTDIILTADHGFSTIAKESLTSVAAKGRYRDVPHGYLPRGFLAADLASALKLPLFQGDGLAVDPKAGEHIRSDSALVGGSPKRPLIAVAANGGSDLIYLFGPQRRALARRIIALLSAEDYTGALFVEDALGPIPGALPLSAIGLKGAALTPSPSIMISFRSAPGACPNPELCAAEIADTEYQKGQGNHGGFSRADTHNLMAAIGPDFRQGFKDPVPVSNADWAPTLAALLRLDLQPKGVLRGRIMTESLTGGVEPPFRALTERSGAAANGFATILNLQMVGDERYFDAAGAPGRVVGLRP
jgi:arylsulfatase A-like enzyme